MKSSKWCVAVVAALLAAAVIWSTSLAQPAGGAKPPAAVKASVCDVAAVFSNYQRARDLFEKEKQRRQSIEAEAEQRAKKIEALQMTLEGLRPDSKEYSRTLEEIERQGMSREIWVKMERSKALREHVRLTKEMYAELMAVVKGIASEQGLHLVLYLDPKELEAQSMPDLLREISGRKVLYHDAGVDITDLVLKRLNENYAKKSP
jgi:Skp family chaperone for outer membrane proteins